MRTLICTILVVTSAIFARAQSVQSSRDADTALIRREIEIICQAFVDKDRKVLEETHGKEWRGFTPGNDHVIRFLVSRRANRVHWDWSRKPQVVAWCQDGDRAKLRAEVEGERGTERQDVRRI